MKPETLHILLSNYILIRKCSKTRLSLNHLPIFMVSYAPVCFVDLTCPQVGGCSVPKNQYGKMHLPSKSSLSGEEPWCIRSSNN